MHGRMLPNLCAGYALPFCRGKIPGRTQRPEFFQVIELTYFGQHDVYQCVLQIEQHPFAAALALHTDRLVTRLRRLLDHILDQRLYVPRRRPAGDDHVVGYGRHVADIELDDILALDVPERLDDEVAQLLAIHACCSSSYVIGLLNYWL